MNLTLFSKLSTTLFNYKKTSGGIMFSLIVYYLWKNKSLNKNFSFIMSKVSSKLMQELQKMQEQSQKLQEQKLRLDQINNNFFENFD